MTTLTSSAESARTTCRTTCENCSDVSPLLCLANLLRYDLLLLASHNAVNVGEDCPVFDGLFEFCQISASGSIGARPMRTRGGCRCPFLGDPSASLRLCLQEGPPSSTRARQTSSSTGAAASTTPRRARHQASATLTIASSASSSC